MKPKPSSQPEIQRLLQRFGACSEALEWAADKNLARQLWHDCPNPEWLLAACKVLGFRRAPFLRQFAICCAQRHQSLLGDQRLIECLEAAEVLSIQANAADRNFSVLRAIATEVSIYSNKTQDWHSLRYAAMQCLCDALLDNSWSASLRASRNGLLAAHEPEAEAEWQVIRLRTLAHPFLNRFEARAHRLLTTIA